MRQRTRYCREDGGARRFGYLLTEGTDVRSYERARGLPGTRVYGVLAAAVQGMVFVP